MTLSYQLANVTFLRLVHISDNIICDYTKIKLEFNHILHLAICTEEDMV